MRTAKLVVFLALVVPPSASAAIVDVAVGPAFTFSPNPVTVAPGDTVRWNFLAPHSSTSDLQSGPEFWDSTVLSSGSFTHTFNTPGSYPYYCTLHSSPAPGGTAMNGVVLVVAPPTLTSVNPVSGPSAGGTLVTVTGTNFAGTCTVDFGGGARLVTAMTATTIIATTPGHAAGPVTVTVNCGAASTSLPGGFTFLSSLAVPLMSREVLMLMAIAIGVAAAIRIARS